MKPHTLYYPGQTPALLHFHNQPNTLYRPRQTPALLHKINQPERNFISPFLCLGFQGIFCLSCSLTVLGRSCHVSFFIFLIYFAHIFLIFSHIDLVIFWLVLVWIYCGVFATIEGSIAPHLSPLVPQSGTRAQIWQIGRKITKEVGLVGKKLNHFLKTKNQKKKNVRCPHIQLKGVKKTIENVNIHISIFNDIFNVCTM